MGFSHSVFPAQSVHEHVLYRDMNLRVCVNVLCLTSPDIDRPLHARYIDDSILLGSDKEVLTLQEDRVHAAYRQAMLPRNDNKCVKATLDEVTVLGVDIAGRRGVISLNPSKLSAIIVSTRRCWLKRW